MKIDQQLDTPEECRLCANYGNHRFELFDSSSGETSSSLSEKILRCLDIEVIWSDPTTVICAGCFNKLHGHDEFREVCHATNRKIRNSTYLHHNGVVFKSDVKHEAVIEPIITYVLLVDSDSESNGEAGKKEISANITPKIERWEDSSVAQTVDLVESSADETPVFESTHVKYEWPENETFSPKLEMIDNEETVESSMDASDNESAADADCGEEARGTFSDDRIGDSPSAANGCESKTDTGTDADEVDHVARAPRKKILQKTRPATSSAVKIKMKHDANKKPKKTKSNAPQLPVKCSFGGRCRESFDSREAIELHVKTYHKRDTKKTFSCHICERTVATKQALKMHMNSLHTQVARFMCPNRDCSKMFKIERTLKVHFNVMHKNQVAFRCTKCSKAFSREHLLKKHLAIEHGEGIAYVCDLCTKSFTTKGHLERHIESTHTQSTLYKCPEATCSKSFKDMSNMKAHFNAVHSEKKDYKCTKCPAKFNWRSNLQNHYALKH